MGVIRKNIVLIILLLLNIVAIFFWFLINNQTVAMMDNIEEVVKEREQVIDQRSQQAELIRKLDEHKDIINKIENYFLEEKDLVYLIEMFENVADDYEVYLEITNLRMADNLRINFRISGQLDNIKDFLAIIENMPHFFGIDNFGLRQIDDNSHLLLMEMIIFSFE